MKRDKRVTAQKQNMYYLIVLIGIAALAALVVINNVQSKKQQELAKQQIELTQQGDDESQIHQTIGEVSKDTAEEPAAEKEEAKKTETKKEEASVPASSNAAKAEVKTAGYDGKSKLEWPLVGNVILPYSMDTTIYFQTLDQYKCNPGMMIQAAENADVSSICAGTVSSVKKDDKLGQMVSIDLGNQFEVQYGQLAGVTLKKGDQVDAGMLVGKVAAPTDFFAKEGTHLYLALTKDKKPVNPMEYLK